MKTIPKEKLDAVIDANRGYYDGTVNLDALTQLEKNLAKASNISSIAWSSLLSAILPDYGGLKPDATNEDIYAIVKALGHEVV